MFRTRIRQIKLETDTRREICEESDTIRIQTFGYALLTQVINLELLVAHYRISPWDSINIYQSFIQRPKNIKANFNIFKLDRNIGQEGKCTKADKRGKIKSNVFG